MTAVSSGYRLTSVTIANRFLTLSARTKVVASGARETHAPAHKSLFVLTTVKKVFVVILKKLSQVLKRWGPLVSLALPSTGAGSMITAKHRSALSWLPRFTQCMNRLNQNRKMPNKNTSSTVKSGYGLKICCTLKAVAMSYPQV